MKRNIVIIAIILVLVVGFSLPFVNPSAEVIAEESYEVDGWRLDIGFDDGDEKLLRFYTEFGREPWLMDGRIYFWTLAEQKAIYIEQKYDDVDVSADIYTINESGKFDSGIYVHANNISGALDGATAWEVNLERGPDSKTYILKLHRFENGKYMGYMAEVPELKLPMNKVHLRVVVKSGVLYAFVNHEKSPIMSYEIGSEEGYVGFRNYYSPNYFDNLSIVGKGNERDTSSDVIIEEATNIDGSKLTEDSEKAINEALDRANNADNQYRLEEAIEDLKTAIKNAIEKRSTEELAAAIERAEKIVDGKIYTQNTWNSLRAVLEIVKTIDLTDEEVLSYWTNRLELKIDLLVEYGG